MEKLHNWNYGVLFPPLLSNLNPEFAQFDGPLKSQIPLTLKGSLFSKQGTSPLSQKIQSLSPIFLYFNLLKFGDISHRESHWSCVAHWVDKILDSRSFFQQIISHRHCSEQNHVGTSFNKTMTKLPNKVWKLGAPGSWFVWHDGKTTWKV